MIHLSSKCDNVTLVAKVCNLILLFFSQRPSARKTKVSSYKINLKLLFSRKHTEDVLVFFSQLDINGRKLYVG